MGTELDWAEKWLYTVLSGDAELAALVAGRIYAYQAPQGAAFPFIVFHFAGGSDNEVIGGARIMTQAVYRVIAVDEGSSFARTSEIDSRVDAILQAASGVVVGGRIVSCQRQLPIRYGAVDAGVQSRHQGGQYRLWIVRG